MSDPVIIHDGDRRIWRRDGTYSISESGCWIPGVYADEATARAAFDFDDWELLGIQNRLNDSEPDPAKRVITMEMLTEERRPR
jgi:hypothetical protein